MVQYLHIFNHSVPLGFTGVLAPDLMAGAALHAAINGGGNPFTQFMSTVGNTVWDTIKASGIQSAIGVGDTAFQNLQKSFDPKSGVTPSDAVASVGAQGIGQFIPGAAS